MAEIAGLKLIVPSSVAGSGVSVSASGKVTFTSAATVSVNGCFISTYDNYVIVIRHKINTGAPEVRIRLRASGTDETGSNYTSQYLEANNTTVSGGRFTTTGSSVGQSDTTASGDHIYVYGPALAQPTASRNVSVFGASGARLTDFAATHSLSTAYDGFTYYPTSGNLTGSLTIYGLSQ